MISTRVHSGNVQIYSNGHVYRFNIVQVKKKGRKVNEICLLIRQLNKTNAVSEYKVTVNSGCFCNTESVCMKGLHWLRICVKSHDSNRLSTNANLTMFSFFFCFEFKMTELNIRSRTYSKTIFNLTESVNANVNNKRFHIHL